MQTQTTPKQTAATTTNGPDLKSLRLPANYGATLGVKKLLTNVLVGKPKKPQFFRTHISDEMTFPAMILENKEARESYVVVPEVAQEVSELVRPVMLHAAIDRHNNVSLIRPPPKGWPTSFAIRWNRSAIAWFKRRGSPPRSRRKPWVKGCERTCWRS